jgi:hypothetical protein
MWETKFRNLAIFGNIVTRYSLILFFFGVFWRNFALKEKETLATIVCIHKFA